MLPSTLFSAEQYLTPEQSRTFQLGSCPRKLRALAVLNYKKSEISKYFGVRLG